MNASHINSYIQRIAGVRKPVAHIVQVNRCARCRSTRSSCERRARTASASSSIGARRSSSWTSCACSTSRACARSTRRRAPSRHSCRVCSLLYTRTVVAPGAPRPRPCPCSVSSFTHLEYCMLCDGLWLHQHSFVLHDSYSSCTSRLSTPDAELHEISQTTGGTGTEDEMNSRGARPATALIPALGGSANSLLI